MLAPTVYYPGNDGDGYGDAAGAVVLDSPLADYVKTGGDCNDADSTVNPGAPERDGDIDHSCNGVANDL